MLHFVSKLYFVIRTVFRNFVASNALSKLENSVHGSYLFAKPHCVEKCIYSMSFISMFCTRCQFKVLLPQVILQDTVQVILPQAMLAFCSRVRSKEELLSSSAYPTPILPSSQVKHNIVRGGSRNYRWRGGAGSDREEHEGVSVGGPQAQALSVTKYLFNETHVLI